MQWPVLFLLVIVSPPLLAYPDQELLWNIREMRREVREMRREAELDEELSIAEAEDFLTEYDRGCRHYDHLFAKSNFKYETNITKENAAQLSRVSLEDSKWFAEMLTRARQFDTGPMPATMRRKFALIKMSTSLKDVSVRKRVEEYGRQLTDIYSSARVCRNSQCYAGETDLVAIYANLTTDYDTLLWAWRAWREATGPKMKGIYEKMVEDMNIGARENGFPDMSVPWMIYEMDDVQLNVTALRLWERVKPLYEQLHAYVRHHLNRRYPGKLQPDGPIPEHLLGNVWGQEWGNIYPLMEPYPEIPSPDVTGAMRRQNYTVKRIFRTAESFFTSLGLPKMTREFWERSLLVEPKDGRIVQCHASAEDMGDPDGEDFRLKMCTHMTEFDLMTAHHEMGHIEYYMMYRDQPCIYRSGANSAFHEAVGDTMQLSVMTPQHLHTIGLATMKDVDGEKDVPYKRSINFLLGMALKKVAFLPYGLLLDSWRWSVFNGATPPDKYNHNWWKLRIGLGGVMPPIDRSENDFDPGSKYHIASNTRYIRYFFSFMTQFQFHRSLCEIKGHRGPIHECDIYNSKEAGRALGDMLSLGRSRPWPDAMETLTGQREVDPEALLEYFRPLQEWLTRENRRNGVKVGWRTENIGVRW